MFGAKMLQRFHFICFRFKSHTRPAPCEIVIRYSEARLWCTFPWQISPQWVKKVAHAGQKPRNPDAKWATWNVHFVQAWYMVMKL